MGKKLDIPFKMKRENNKMKKLMAESKLINRAMNKGIRKALRMHALLGVDTVEWRNGKVVRVSPKELKKRLKIH